MYVILYRVDRLISVIMKKKGVVNKGRFFIDGVSIVKLLTDRRKKLLLEFLYLY